jgi:hypothetical protein
MEIAVPLVLDGGRSAVLVALEFFPLDGLKNGLQANFS